MRGQRGEKTADHRLRLLCVVGLLLLGAAVRLPGLADDPPGFHTMRQLHSATIARAMYLDVTRPSDDPERISAVRPTSIEPPVNEVIVTGVYLVTGEERLWVARAMSIVYWTVGAAALWAILRRFTNLTGQIVGVAVYQLAPIGIEGGRSFQPDALMVGLALVGMWLQVRLVERPSFRRALPAVSVTASALIIKPVAAPIVLGFWAGLLLWRHDWRKLFAPRVIAATAAMVAPAGAVYVWLLRTNAAARAHSDRSFFPDLFGQWSYYDTTWTMISRSVTTGGVLLALAATVLVEERRRQLLVMLWLSYIAYNIPSNYRTATHDYYHLPLVVIVALSIGMAVEPVQRFLEAHTAPPVRRAAAATGIALILAFAFSAAATRSEGPGGSAAVARYRQVSELTGPGARVLAVTNDYASGLRYYAGLSTRHYPTVADDRLQLLGGEEVRTPAQIIEQTDAQYLVILDPVPISNPLDLAAEIEQLTEVHLDETLGIWELPE